jgi:D-glycero-beta-D-manno-heptose 1-phosphate adenylyltransferase
MDKLSLIQSRVIPGEALDHKLNIWRFQGDKIVFTNGCFDILHLGHVEYLAKAAALGDRLIIGLNTDASISRLKGHSRPLNSDHARAMLLASLFFVSAVVLFDEDTPSELIRQVKPDILVKGSDYTIDQIVGADFVQANGGSVHTIELLDGYSTTSIIEKIKAIPV